MKKLVLAIMVLLIATPLMAAKIPYRICEPCLGIDENITVTTDVQVICGNTNTPNSDYTYGFYACGGAVYTFSLCPEYGGSADYDTAFGIQGPDVCGNDLGCNDDWCGLQSELIWTAPADGNYIAVVDGFSSYTGNFCLAYVGSAITATEEGNWSSLKSLY